MNVETIIVAVIAAVPATIAAIAAWRQSLKTKEAVDGRMTELLALAKAEAKATATLDEQTAERSRKGEAAIQSQRSMTTNQEGSE